MFKQINNTVESLKKTDSATLAGIRNLLFMAILVDMFVVFWYLGARRLGSALLIVIMIVLGIVLYLEQQKGGKNMALLDEEKKEETKEEVKEKKDSKEEEDEQDGMFDMGLPSSEEYEKRVNKAIGI